MTLMKSTYLSLKHFSIDDNPKGPLVEILFSIRTL
jgi:hypothetical protein